MKDLTFTQMVKIIDMINNMHPQSIHLFTDHFCYLTREGRAQEAEQYFKDQLEGEAPVIDLLKELDKAGQQAQDSLNTLRKVAGK